MGGHDISQHVVNNLQNELQHITLSTAMLNSIQKDVVQKKELLWQTPSNMHEHGLRMKMQIFITY